MLLTLFGNLLNFDNLCKKAFIIHHLISKVLLSLIFYKEKGDNSVSKITCRLYLNSCQFKFYFKFYKEKKYNYVIEITLLIQTLVNTFSSNPILNFIKRREIILLVRSLY